MNKRHLAGQKPSWSPSKVGVADATSAMIHAIQFGGAVEQLGTKDGGRRSWWQLTDFG